jgi:hypothetical protein
MLQIKTFELPSEEAPANEFLKTHKPMGEIARMGDLLFIAYETGENPVEYQIADLTEFIRGAQNAKLQQEIAVRVMEYELADLKVGKGRYDEVSMAIRNTKAAMDIQDVKIAFVEERIAALRASNEGN